MVDPHAAQSLEAHPAASSKQLSLGVPPFTLSLGLLLQLCAGMLMPLLAAPHRRLTCTNGHGVWRLNAGFMQCSMSANAKAAN
jgi:hypothetical protein